MKDEKNGFTLIEIIICIALVSIIGSISVISVSKMNEEGKIRKELENILQTYLSVNSSILHNIGPNAEGAIVPLNLIKITKIIIFLVNILMIDIYKKILMFFNMLLGQEVNG